MAPDEAALPLLLLAAALLVAGVSWIEAGPGAAREVTLVATLAAVAAAGRVLLAAVPGVQPVTVIAVAAGAALGARAGFATGALALSRTYPGAGASGTTADVLGGLRPAGQRSRSVRQRVEFAGICFVLGFAFSSMMDLWLWLSFFTNNWEALTVVIGRGGWSPPTTPSARVIGAPVGDE